MTITVDIRPEIQAELARQAAAYGGAIEAYAARLLEEAVHPPAVTKQPAFDKERAQAAAARRTAGGIGRMDFARSTGQAAEGLGRGAAARC